MATTPPGWVEENGALHREFRFADFSEAFGFMARVALLADKADHHPNWSNVYNRVVIDLSTHDAGDVVTDLDIQLANAINALVG
jgi:4a-hydroxytetrahydrobiopterin dehydratase